MNPEQNIERQMKMNHADILRSSASKVNELASNYGPRELVFDRAARLASILLDKEFNAYEVSMITAALNLAHLQSNRSDPSNYVSAIVNVAFAGQFAGSSEQSTDELLQNIENIAKRFAPQPENAE